jgi:hypothetical protein
VDFKQVVLWLLGVVAFHSYQNNLSASEQQTNLSCCYPGSYFVQGEVLYWTPRITGLELNFGTAEIVENVVGCTQILTTTEADLDPHFKWDAGCRISAGCALESWEMKALWTHFQGKGKRGDTSNLSIPNHGTISVTFDQIDCTLAYNCARLPIDLRPFIGIRTLRIHEHLRAQLTTEIFLFSESTALESKSLNDKQKYWGAGPLVGVQGDWEIGRGFGFYSTVAASLLYGDYEIKFDDADIFSAPIPKRIFSTSRRHVHTFDFNVDLALGVSWHRVVCNQYDLTMKLGFEHHQYFNHNHLCIERGDVSFTGGVFSFQVGF